MPNISMYAGSIGGTLNLANSGTVVVPASGIISVDSRDAVDLLRLGATYMIQKTRSTYFGAPAVGAAAKFVASASFAAGTLAIAAQPDVPRLASVRIDPGTSAITSGNVAVNYVANTGATVTDNFSAIGGGTTIQSTNLTYGAIHLNSVIVTGVTGGASPGIQMDSLNVLAATVDPNFGSFAVLKNTVDNADSGVISTYASAGAYAPSVAPNGTHTYGLIAGFASQG